MLTKKGQTANRVGGSATNCNEVRLTHHRTYGSRIVERQHVVINETTDF